MKETTLTYKGYSMVLKGPDSKDKSYGGSFEYPGNHCIVAGQTFEEAKADFEQFVDEHLDDLKQEKRNVEAVLKRKTLFKTTVEYMGVLGSVEVDSDNKGFMGHILKAPKEYTYKGKDYDSFINDFHTKVEKYSKSIKNTNCKQYKGSFNVRISSNMHQDAVAYAIENNISLNKLVEIAIREKIYE